MCFSRYSSLRRKASRVRSGAILSIFAHARKYLELDSDNIAVAAVLDGRMRNGILSIGVMAATLRLRDRD